ncbi:MAG: hypothetical protein [Caudoviricetes sp.]|nr:MAG: hypothetical protein [Caudoviricetes sp.]
MIGYRTIENRVTCDSQFYDEIVVSYVVHYAFLPFTIFSALNPRQTLLSQRRDIFLRRRLNVFVSRLSLFPHFPSYLSLVVVLAYLQSVGRIPLPVAGVIPRVIPCYSAANLTVSVLADVLETFRPLLEFFYQNIYKFHFSTPK